MKFEEKIKNKFLYSKGLNLIKFTIAKIKYISHKMNDHVFQDK